MLTSAICDLHSLHTGPRCADGWVGQGGWHAGSHTSRCLLQRSVGNQRRPAWRIHEVDAGPDVVHEVDVRDEPIDAESHLGRKVTTWHAVKGHVDGHRDEEHEPL